LNFHYVSTLIVISFDLCSTYLICWVQPQSNFIMQPLYQVSDFQPASLFKRFFARLLDRLFAIFLVFIGFKFVKLFDNSDSESIGILVGILLALIYLLVKDALPFLNGQSLGKKAMSIRVIDNNNASMITNEYGKAISREIVQWIPLLNIIDAIMVFSDNGRRLGDKWADTYVVEV
jgi:uncharacterized RDD family membrane protein YckC